MAEIPTADWTWINATAEQFERAWNAGTRPQIEEFLSDVAGPRRARLLDELLRVERELRRRAGEQPVPEEYHERFPEHCPVIDSVFGEEPEPPSLGDGETSTGRSAPVTASFDRSRIRGVLAGLAETIGSVPRVLLRDTKAEPETPVVRPSSREMPEDTGRYQILGEIGHGGMGAVLKGRDPDLGRDLAVKILLEEHQGTPELVHRFVEEAQIGGQLQHPGIVPVYELGSFGGRRPYFTMKLVMGRTLAALLAARPTPAHDLPRFLGIFEQICQTMAYAHARGVIHRDLKPSNIMVGSFGEVQVMDWGLAKVLPRGGTVDEPRTHPDEMAVSVIRTVRTGSETNASRSGSVLGTPAYMAPEQAGGNVEAINERADVFGLGSILCEVLTSQPAYTGPSSQAILRKAIQGETGDALRRLDTCGVDAELVALAGHCLATEAEQRPRHAGEVARRLTAYLAGAQERLRAAELARAAEEARAEEAQATAAVAERARLAEAARAREARAAAEAAERARAAEEARAKEAQAAAEAAEGRAHAERRARRMTVGLAASVLIAAALGAAGWRWVERDRMVRMAAISTRVNAALQEATRLTGHAQGAAVGDLAPWVEALAAARSARELIESGSDLALRRQVDALLAAITSAKDTAEARARAAQSDRRLLDKLIDIRSAKADDPEGSATDADYASAFREAGIDVTQLPPAEAGTQIKARPATVAAALAAALDDWASVRRSRRSDRPGALRLAEAANLVDPDPARVGLRRALDLPDPASRAKVLRELAASTKQQTAPAADLDLLGKALYEVGESKAAEDVLRAGRRIFPDDVWLNYDLAYLLDVAGRGEEAIRYYSIARALRPETAHELGHVLERKGEAVEAVAVFQDLVRLRPDDGRNWGCYGRLLQVRGDSLRAGEALEKAVAIVRESVRLKPDDPVPHDILAAALNDQGKPQEAITEYWESIRLEPGHATTHYNLGNLLKDQGMAAEAIAEWREAIRLRTDFALPHYNLGIALKSQGKVQEAIAEFRQAIQLKPDDAVFHYNLGIALYDEGKLPEALAADREAIRLKPDYADAYTNLGLALSDQGKQEEAIAAHLTAIRLKPGLAVAHHNLGVALGKQGKLEEAIAAYREAIRIQPRDALAHNNLGDALDNQGKFDDAIAELRTAINLKPDLAVAHNNLGNAQNHQGRLEEAVAEYRTAIRFQPGVAAVHYNLGNALKDQGKREEAIAAYREAIRIKPDYAEFHVNLGIALADQGKREEAITEYREAIRIKPDLAEAHCNLGFILRGQGDYAASLAEYRRGHELGSKRPGWRHPSAQWVMLAERLASLAERLPAISKGTEKPKDTAEALSFAQMCYDRGLHNAAARLWGEALEADPMLDADRQAQHRYNAVCAAALAGCGQGKDDAPPNETARAKLRTQALDWLRGELAFWARRLESESPQVRPAIVQTLQHWKVDTDLAGIRDPDALARLPDPERKAWQTLWANVDALVAKARGRPAP